MDHAGLRWALESQKESREVKFTNELHNPIRLKVQLKPISGVRADTQEAMKNMPGVLIELEGPTSLSENHITRMEAEKLYSELGRVLGK